MEINFGELNTWIIILQIIMVDIILAGDNAVVIGMAASKLEADSQKKVIMFGTAGAILLRLIMAFFLVEALHIIPALHLIAGVVLLWIALKLVLANDEDTEVEAKSSLKEAIITIILADAMMSIDNVIAVVATANGNYTLVVAGILITVPIIVYSSAFFAKIIGKYPIILTLGGSLLGWVAGGMIVEDNLIKEFIAGHEIIVKLFCTALVIMVSIWKTSKEKIS
ncbi:TerC family protein [uncultured Veillonella sp.]|uniref:TerC family protein n=1 Tax=uncultured Veillonella sp. TaxID=159268 RepID=UPI0025E0C009|nr:TerC family protein [uncultured Veillonella sp.]MDY3974227.1 TerC family protein [Veillonella caviae]